MTMKEKYNVGSWLELAALGVEGKLDEHDHGILQAGSGGHCDVAGAYVVIIRKLDSLITKVDLLLQPKAPQ